MNETQDYIPRPGSVSSPSAEMFPCLSDPRVAQAVEEFQAGLMAGQQPDREHLLNQFPEIRNALGECLEALALLVQASPATPDGDQTSSDLFRQPLGDFRLVREVGRGGMGTVYEAVQITLNRRVALKVLPHAAAFDARQLQRFKNEAQAAALLHHPNIVAVHAVGHDRGVHYFAMQLIDGDTLADVIARRREARRADYSSLTVDELTRTATPPHVGGEATLLPDGAEVLIQRMEPQPFQGAKMADF
jgi:hypothetical protein